MSHTKLKKMKEAGEKIAMLTAYDASFSALAETAGVDVLLVGDSLGNVVQGQSNTLVVSIEAMEYHTAAVCRGVSESLLVIADLPALQYYDTRSAIETSRRLLAAGAQMVKLEGAGPMVEVALYLSQRGVAVCGHLGLTPQSVHKLGGFRVQAREAAEQQKLRCDALALERAGCDVLVLECVPSGIARQIAEELTIPVIGIGAGVDVDGQVLVCYDALGITQGKLPRFVHNFGAESGNIAHAMRAYVQAVKSQSFPAAEHSYG